MICALYDKLYLVEKDFYGAIINGQKTPKSRKKKWGKPPSNVLFNVGAPFVLSLSTSWRIAIGPVYASDDCIVGLRD